MSPCLFNLYAEYITRNAGLEEAQAGIKIAGRNINNLRYADDTTDVTEKVQTTEGVVSTKDLDETAKDNLVDDQAGILTDKTKESDMTERLN